ncbi:MAG: hypothetical protein WC709_08625, partial [Thermoleophilia bacterium]
MSAADLAYAVYKTGWAFYALGPQLAICLLLGYLTARKTGGSLLNWLVTGFATALLPLLGVLIMAVLWWRAGAHAQPTPPAPHAGR